METSGSLSARDSSWQTPELLEGDPLFPARPLLGPAAAALASSATPSRSPLSASWAIPVAPRARDPELPSAAPYHQSAPVQVPVPPPWSCGRKWDDVAGGLGDGDDDEELFSGDTDQLGWRSGRRVREGENRGAACTGGRDVLLPLTGGIHSSH
ncbi:unnamed protein product [Urochloa humidicola]